MLKTSLIKNASQVYVMAVYLSDLCKKIGKDAYLESFIRAEHGTGTGFFGIGNTGSIDCVKERLRGITDSLDQKYKTWKKIDFVSESCKNLENPDFRNIHRVEHTREIQNLYRDFENDFIISGKKFTVPEIIVWVITHQVVCLIEQKEQRPQNFYDDNVPFSKYTKPIFYKNKDISNYTLEQLRDLNRTRFKLILDSVAQYDFAEAIKKQTDSLLRSTKKHTLPPIKLAVDYHNNQFELLYHHYHHKVNKRTNPQDKKWYDPTDTALWNEWKREKNEKLSMA